MTYTTDSWRTPFWVKYTLQWCKVNEDIFRYCWHLYQTSRSLWCRVSPYCYCHSCYHAKVTWWTYTSLNFIYFITITKQVIHNIKSLLTLYTVDGFLLSSETRDINKTWVSKQSELIRLYEQIFLIEKISVTGMTISVTGMTLFGHMNDNFGHGNNNFGHRNDTFRSQEWDYVGNRNEKL